MYSLERQKAGSCSEGGVLTQTMLGLAEAGSWNSVQVSQVGE